MTTATLDRPTDKVDRAEQLKAIMAELDAKLATLTTSDDWRATLDVAARFHHYSFSNVLWLSMQAQARLMPLERVAGFRTWQGLGRQVRTGEKSLKVLAPMRCKVTDEKTAEVRVFIKGFTVASVFELSQTDGEDLPEIRPSLLQGEQDKLLAHVVDVINARGFAVSYEPTAEMNGANGYTDHAAKRVVVRSDASSAQQLKTAVHELAHVILHNPADVDYHSNRPRCECEAESVAYVVCKAFGVATDDYSLPYVATWSRGDMATVRAVADTVVKTSHVVIGELSPTDDAQ